MLFCATAVTLSVLIGVSMPGTGADATHLRCRGADLVDGWTRLPVDGLTGSVLSYAVAPHDPERILASDGQRIVRSMDGGCSWGQVFEPSSVLPVRLGIGLDPEVGDLSIPRSGSSKLAFATVTQLSGRQAMIGPQVIRSDDGGATWELASTGLPPVGQVEILALAPSDAARLYLMVKLGVDVDPRGARVLYRSDDAGASWELSTQPAATAAQLQTQPVGDFSDLIVDPYDSDKLWATTSEGLYSSSDAGATWEQVDPVSDAVRAVGVFAGSDAAHLKVFADLGTGGHRSDDSGASWTAMEAPARDSARVPLVGSVAHGQGPDDVVIAAEGYAWGSVYRWEDEAWIPIRAQEPALHSVSSDLTADPHFYAASESDLWVYEGPLPQEEATVPLPVVSEVPVEEGLCPPWEQPPPYYGPVEPAPVTDQPIYVGSMEGVLVKFDRFGKIDAAVDIPEFSEGMALDNRDRVMITTRYSNSVARYDEESGEVEPIAAVFSVEGPAFDKDQRLFVANNATTVSGGQTGLPNLVYELDPPVNPGTIPELIWRFSGREFIEDLKVAPEDSPFAGDLFVLLNTEEDFTNPTGVARLTRTPAGWQREANLIERFPEGITSAGMAFQSNGHLLITGTTGEVLEYGPTGEFLGVFACVDRPLMKIDVTRNDFVYLTTGFVRRRGAYVVRLDPTGRRMLPDFDAGAVGATTTVGIAVPHFPPEIPPDPPPPPPPDSPVAAGGIQQQPGPPPGIAPQIQSANQTQTNPNMQPNAQQPASQPQAQQQGQQQSQSHAQMAAVAQRQEQPQMAFVHAARSLKEQTNMGNAMVRSNFQRRKSVSVRTLGTAAGLLLFGALGFARALEHRVRTARPRVRKGR